MNNRLLVVTPKWPWPETGACEQDRAQGIRDFIRLGYDVRVVTHIRPSQVDSVKQDSEELGIPVYPILYHQRPPFFKGGWKEVLARMIHPRYLDGAAYEYSLPEIQEVVRMQIEEWKPFATVFDFSFLWPLYPIAKKNHVPIITKIQTYEAGNYLDENGVSFIKLLKFIPKYFNEKLMTRQSDWIWAITPKERDLFTKFGAKHVSVVPLRKLHEIIKVPAHEPKQKEVLDIVFLAASYHMRHNRFAMDYVVKEIAPRVLKKHPGKYRFHILGKNFPEHIKAYLNEDVVHEGYVPDLQAFLANMDVAICPSLLGHGMQQKVYEPIVKGLPLITNARVMAGYPLEDRKEVRLAETPDDFVKALEELSVYENRVAQSKAARAKSFELFSTEPVDAVVQETLQFFQNADRD